MRLTLGLGLGSRGSSAVVEEGDDGTLILADLESASSIDGMVITESVSPDTIYPSSSDGLVQFNFLTNYALVHDSTFGSSVDDTTPVFIEATYTTDGEEFEQSVIGRAFLPFDMSAVFGTLASATLYLTATSEVSGTAKISVQAATAGYPLTIQDYDAFTGSTFGQTALINAAGEYSITLNAAGLAYLQGVVGGTANLCLREYDHDYTYLVPDNIEHYAKIQMSEIGGASRPRLVFTYA